MIIGSADSQGLLRHTPPPILSGILTPTHTISYAVQNYQTLEWFLESLYATVIVQWRKRSWVKGYQRRMAKGALIKGAKWK